MVAEGPLTAAQIFEQITGGEGTQSLSDAHESAGQLTTRTIERAAKIHALRKKTMAGWQGGAGIAAADSTVPLIQAAQDDAIHLKNAQDAVSSQMGAFGTAKNSVKPVSAQPPEITAEDLVNVMQGNNSYNTKVTSWQVDSQANIDAFSSYHSASSTNGEQMPAQYAQITDSGAPISMEQPGDAGKGKTGGFTGKDTGDPGNGRNGQDGRPGQTSMVPSQQTQHPGQTPGQTPGQDPSGGWRPPGGTTPSSDNTEANHYVPKPIAPPPVNPGYQFGPTGQPISNVGGGNPNFGGFGPYGTGGGYGPGGSGPGGSGPGGTGGYRTGSGGVNEPGTRGPGAGSGGRMPEERMPGGGRGMGPGGAAGARGANGMPMGAGGGKGKKEEDKEKKAASYLQNPDPDETFGGSDVKPMPPVIGEKQPKK